MANFSREKASKILKNEIDVKDLVRQYPELEQKVMEEISEFSGGKNVSQKDVAALVEKYRKRATHAIDKIQQSKQNKVVIDAFLPEVIKVRIALYIIDQAHLLSKVQKNPGRIRFNLWDGFILQKILFRKDFERKPASLGWFKLFWPLIRKKDILMPLVNKKGIYCFYSKQLIRELVNLIGDLKCIEVAAGDGTLSRFLGKQGIECIATDDYSWNAYIKYPEDVEKLSAREALALHRPTAVICSWTPPKNDFEHYIFENDAVDLYIVIGTKNPTFSGNHEVYEKQTKFSMEYSETLSKKILPLSEENAVYIFRRKKDNDESSVES